MRSLFITLAFTLALVGQLAALVHLFVVHHEVCPEHGQLVEENGDHCIQGLNPAQMLEAPSLDVGATIVTEALTRPLVAPMRAESHTLLRFAPKTSPPARA